MRNIVKVWNDNIYPFEQMYNNRKISIPAGEFVEMDYWDAESFVSKYSPMKFDGMGNPKPESYKKLRIEGTLPHLLDQEMPEEFVCHCCGDKLTSKQALEDHIDKYHLDSLDDQKLAEKRKKGQK